MMALRDSMHISVPDQNRAQHQHARQLSDSLLFTLAPLFRPVTASSLGLLSTSHLSNAPEQLPLAYTCQRPINVQFQRQSQIHRQIDRPGSFQPSNSCTFNTRAIASFYIVRSSPIFCEARYVLCESQHDLQALTMAFGPSRRMNRIDDAG